MHSNSRVKLSWMIKELQTCTRWQTCGVDRENLLPIIGPLYLSLWISIVVNTVYRFVMFYWNLLPKSKKHFWKGKSYSIQVTIEIQKNTPRIRILTHCYLYMYKRPPVKSRKVSHLFPNSLHSSSTVCVSVNIRPSVSFWTSVVEVAWSIFKVSHNLI